MWSQLLLCLLVGFAFAAQPPAWKRNTEYTYNVTARSVVGLNQISKNYSGIILKAQLTLATQSEDFLAGKINNAAYAEIYDELEDGWEADIPDEKLDYQPIQLSDVAFQLELHETAIRNLIVDATIPNWEANIIKSFVSQFQLDTNGANMIKSHYNLRPVNGENAAVFKTMEDTVSGMSETLYDIHALPEYVLQTYPWLVRIPDLGKSGDTIEVVKTKNYTHSPLLNLPSYYFGLHGVNYFEPDNKVAHFSSRTSETRAVITGNLSRYTIQNVLSVDEIILRPTMMDKQIGSVNTMFNVSLERVTLVGNPYDLPTNPVKAGLVYRYNDPFSASNTVREGSPGYQGEDISSSEADGYSAEASARRRLARQPGRVAIDDSFKQEQPRLLEPPKSPMLPFTVGYDGQAFSKKHNIVVVTYKLAQQIGIEVQRPELIPGKNTVGKFLILTSLVRLMDADEMEQAANKLYTMEKRGGQAAAWQTFRDAIAEAGTGPAFMTIRKWIKTKKISEKEAADALATNAYSTRQPTDEYIAGYFETIIKDEEIMGQDYLNETALLAYSHLVHEVCVHKNVSHSKYPENSFGPFCTEKSEKLVIEQVIPYLKEKLDKAISEGNTQHIHVYIRALGNVGHRRILEAFKPYLEGHKHVSQYQRLLMVVALDKLVRSNPKVARSVLYKIYQNVNDHEQVRAAAVFQLMRTNPPASMLQRMATYTNIDPNNYVNAAVKSSIEAASNLGGAVHKQLRSAAHAAKPLLTPEQYGRQYSHQNMTHYVIKELGLEFYQQIESFGGRDSLLNSGFKYVLYAQHGGFERLLVNKQAIVSSIDDLIDVFNQQTDSYLNEQAQKKSQPQNPWSSESVADILQMKGELREQLEGNLYQQIGYLQQIFAFDNQTIESLPQAIKDWEERISKGEPFDLKKMTVAHETVFTIPTGLGLPFIYTYDIPIIARFESDVKVVAQPAISTGDVLRVPKTVDVEFELRGVFSGRTQSQFGFFTPYNSQRYSAGYDKNFQVVIPLAGSIQMDTDKNEISMEFHNADQGKDIPLLHYSTWPYTAKDDIYAPEPQRNPIGPKYPQEYSKVYGEKSMGIAVKVDVKGTNKLDFVTIYEKFSKYDPLTVLLSPWPSDNIQHNEVNVTVDSAQSFTKKLVVKVGYKQQYKSGEGEQGSKCEGDLPDNSSKRQEEAIKRVSAGIKSADSGVVDASIIFQSDESQPEIQYNATFARAKSNVDPKSSFLALVTSIDRDNQTSRKCVEGDGRFPNTNGLNLDYAMNMDPTSDVKIRAYLSGSQQQPSDYLVQAKLSKSEERQKYLQESDDYQQCVLQMEEGNNQLHACARATADANLLDQFAIDVTAHNADPRVVNYTYMAYSILRHKLYPRFQENIVYTAPASKRDLAQRIHIQGQFSPDLQSVNAYISTPSAAVEIKDIQLSEFAQSLWVPHPVFHTKARLMAYAYKYDTYRPICVIDKSAASTFDNKTYDVSLSDEWTVLLQYVPRRPAQDSSEDPSLVYQHLKDQIESYVVFVRNVEGNNKEVRMVVQAPKTQQRTVKIELKPKDQSALPRLFVDDIFIQYNDQESTDISNGFIQAYALPNNELKVEIKGIFYAIYDGERVKVTAVNSKYMDASRGLCGTFTGKPTTDFLGPDNCIIRGSQDLVKSYTVKSKNDAPIKKRSTYDDRDCYQEKVEYVEVISSQDVGKSGNNYINKPLMSAPRPHKYSDTSCTMLQTKYVVEANVICFSRRLLPVCKPGCYQVGNLVKNVSVHCMAKSSVAKRYQREIDEGASPDFSYRPHSRFIKMEMPQRCTVWSEI